MTQPLVRPNFLHNSKQFIFNTTWFYYRNFNSISVTFIAIFSSINSKQSTESNEKMEKTMTIIILFGLIIFQASASPFPHFFPNFSSIPPSLIPPPNGGVWDGFHKLGNCQPGQFADGLAKLKQYFNYFGYINQNSSANFTDDFDDGLQSAIRTYQKNFNLNVTGELDAATLEQIVKPRCGVADIVNGTTTMNSGKWSPSGSGVHTVGHYSFFPGSPRWPDSKRDLTYAFLPANQLPEEVKGVFARAFSRWSEVIPMTFTETSAYRSADIRIGFFSGDHGDGEAFDGVLGTLAHAFSPPSGMFHLDGDENWVIDGESASSMSAVDLESVAVHEIGHLLGLGHSSVEEAIMYPTISSSTKKVSLQNDDVEGIQSLYGSNPNYNGSSTGLGQERDASGSRPNFAGLSGPGLLFGALLLLFIL